MHNTYHIGDAVYELTLGLCLSSPNIDDVVDVGENSASIVVSGDWGEKMRCTHCGSMAGRSWVPVEKMREGKLDIPQTCTIGESIPSEGFVAARHAGRQHYTASHCTCYSLTAERHPGEAFILGVCRQRGPTRRRAMALCEIASKIRAAALDMRAFPSSVFGYSLCRVMRVIFELMRGRVNEEKRKGESVEGFPNVAGSGPTRR